MYQTNFFTIESKLDSRLLSVSWDWYRGWINLWCVTFLSMANHTVWNVNVWLNGRQIDHNDCYRKNTQLCVYEENTLVISIRTFKNFNIFVVISTR